MQMIDLIAERQPTYGRGLLAIVTKDMDSMDFGDAGDGPHAGRTLDLYALALATLDGRRSLAARPIIR